MVIKMIKIIVFLFLLSSGNVNAQESIPIYFFWGEGCPHCHDEKKFLDELKQKYPQIDIKSYEVWFHKENKKLYQQLSLTYQTSSGSVPATFIGDQVWIGFNSQRGTEIEEKIKRCIEKKCIDPLAQVNKVLSQTDVATSKSTLSPSHPVCVEVFIRKDCQHCQNVMAFINYLSKKYNIMLRIHDVTEPKQKEHYEKVKKIYSLKSGAFPIVFIDNNILIGDRSVEKFLESKIAACVKKECICPEENFKGIVDRFPKPSEITPEQQAVIDIPFLGKFDASKISLPVFTIILGFLDGFNPCAFFVLFLLLSLLIHARSKSRMYLVGGIFVLFSGIIYFLFMAAWLNLFMVIGQLDVITKTAGLIAVIISLINIKEFFFFGKGVSLTIPEGAKPVLFERMRNILKAGSMTGVIIGTIILAIAANTYELLCTAGFPMVFARVLTLQNLTMFKYYLYLAFYNLVYIIPLLVIVIIFSSTLGAKKLTEWQGRVLKLISGLMMLGLGTILIFKPALLNNIIVSVSLILSVLLISFAIAFTVKKYKK